MWQVKQMVCKELAHKVAENIQETPIHPSAIKLTQKLYADREIKDSENGMLLLELRLKAGDSFSVGRRAKSEGLKEIVQMGDGPARLTAEAR